MRLNRALIFCAVLGIAGCTSYKPQIKFKRCEDLPKARIEKLFEDSLTRLENRSIIGPAGENSVLHCIFKNSDSTISVSIFARFTPSENDTEGAATRFQAELKKNNLDRSVEELSDLTVKSFWDPLFGQVSFFIPSYMFVVSVKGVEKSKRKDSAIEVAKLVREAFSTPQNSAVTGSETSSTDS